MDTTKDGIIEKDQQAVSIGHYINYIRVATALAIIKTKPQGCRTLQHAKSVCSQFVCNQSAWREKVIFLEDKVLELEQQLLQNKMLKDLSKSDGDSQLVFPTPPSSSDPVATESESQSISVKKPPPQLSKHIEFLTSLINLKQGDTLVLNMDEKTKEVTLKTLKKSLGLIQTWLCDPELQQFLSERMVSHSVGVILCLVDSRHQALQKEVITEVCAVLEAIMVELIRHRALNKWMRQEKLQNIVLMFCESSTLYGHIVILLIECIQRYAGLLRQSKMEKKIIDPCMFENTSYIFNCFEKVIHFGKEKHFHLLNCGALILQLEDSLLHIADYLPAFSLNVWHISGLLETIKKLNYAS